MGDHEWRFRFPRLTPEAHDAFDAAVDHLRQEEYGAAIRDLRALLKRFPEFIDARHHLAIALEAEESGLGLVAAREWSIAVAAGQGALPAGFVVGQDRLEWGWVENRPFLRACQGLALSLMEGGYTGEAVAIWRDMLDLNPNDNQGVRALLVNGLFERRRVVDVLELCGRYADDGMPALLFGRVLALYMLGRKQDAAAALAEAARVAPQVARELTKKTHAPPRDMNPGYVTAGGADEAYYYWMEAGELWKRGPGALAFVRSSLNISHAGTDD